MGHLLIAYDLLVIMIGLCALSIAGFWALKSGEAYLRNFCILYACFTAMMVVSVLSKYSALNIPDFPNWDQFILSGVIIVLGWAIVVATIYFFHELYQFKARKALSLLFLVVGLISIALILSPIGATFHQNEVWFGPGALASFGLYILSFTYLLIIGFAFIGRVWKSDKRVFVIGLLVFAVVGYLDGIVSFIGNLRYRVVTITAPSGFLFSSIPYALYGIFLIFYFLQYTLPTGMPQEVPNDLVSRYGITEREQEIILKVIQGKSNTTIANELYISLATVKTHLNNIYRKMDLDGRFDLITRIRSS